MTIAGTSLPIDVLQAQSADRYYLPTFAWNCRDDQGLCARVCEAYCQAAAMRPPARLAGVAPFSDTYRPVPATAAATAAEQLPMWQDDALGNMPARGISAPGTGPGETPAPGSR